MPTNHDHEPEQLAEILRRNREVSRLRIEWERLRSRAKDAKTALEEAQDDLNGYIYGLDAEYPLFDAPALSPAITLTRFTTTDADGRVSAHQVDAGAEAHEPDDDQAVTLDDVPHAEVDAAEAAPKKRSRKPKAAEARA